MHKHLEPVAPSNADDLEPNRAQLLGIDEKAAVKDKGRLVHALVDGLPVDLGKLLPLGRDHHRLSALARLDRRLVDRHLLLDCRRC
jgi:hypothetical protein